VCASLSLLIFSVCVCVCVDFSVCSQAKKYHNHLTDLRHLDGINKIPIGAIIYLFQEKVCACLHLVHVTLFFCQI
jgi:hypothetical protein